MYFILNIKHLIPKKRGIKWFLLKYFHSYWIIKIEKELRKITQYYIQRSVIPHDSHLMRKKHNIKDVLRQWIQKNTFHGQHCQTENKLNLKI